MPQWREGDPPDFGDLGEEGEGNVLVVHALESEEAVDVWLVGDAEPVATALAPRDAIRLEGIPREARRVVLARAGTPDAVAYLGVVPLRADEQWASVATLGEHDCTAGANGVTPTFQQTQALAGNTVRFVHAAAADPLTIERQSVPEPGVLEPGGTVLGTDLPDCENSGREKRWMHAYTREACAREERQMACSSFAPFRRWCRAVWPHRRARGTSAWGWCRRRHAGLGWFWISKFVEQRLGQGFSGTAIKSFRIPRSAADDLVRGAVPESLAKGYPNAPIIVDTTKAPGQYGLRGQQSEALRRFLRG